MKRGTRIERLFVRLTGEELARLSIANFVEGVDDQLSGRPAIERLVEARRVRDRARLLPDPERRVFEDMTNAAVDVEQLARVAVPPLAGLSVTQAMTEVAAAGWEAASRALEALVDAAAQAEVLAHAGPALAQALAILGETLDGAEPAAEARAEDDASNSGDPAATPLPADLPVARVALAAQLAEAREHAAILRHGLVTTAATRIAGAAAVRRQIDAFAPRLRGADPLPLTIRRMLEQAESQPAPRSVVPEPGTTSRPAGPAQRWVARARTRTP